MEMTVSHKGDQTIFRLCGILGKGFSPFLGSEPEVE